MQTDKSPTINKVAVTGGAGYVGAVLVPKLLDAGYEVAVLDLYMYGEKVFGEHHDNPRLTEIKGDIRNIDVVRKAFDGADAVIHLACISNDPSFELDPDLGKSINLDAFQPMVRAAKEAGVKRFIYASSSSVYGIKEGVEVTEDLSLEPLTDYSQFKADCEKILDEEREPGFTCVTIRPATVCGYSPRQRLDVVVNIFTNLAWNKNSISVFGGSQRRPNIHIKDMCNVYLLCLAADEQVIDGETFNAGYENHQLLELAEIVKSGVGPQVELSVVPTDDLRSYHVNSDKIKEVLKFEPQHTIRDAVDDLVVAFKEGKLTDSLDNPEYFNIKTMQNISLT